MKRKEEENQSQLTTFEMATAFTKWLSRRTNKNIALPTLEQLRLEKELGQIQMTGIEWTREGFIYDPVKDEVNREPKKSDTACFRIVSEQKT